MNTKTIGELTKKQTEKFAVYQQKDGALCALSIADFTNSNLLKASEEFRSYGRALVAKHALESRVSDGGANA
ncbi:MAG: hypothetical protein ABJN04_14590 [Hyphomicrobiales bacterium]